MGKLQLGNMMELSERIAAIEETEVVKALTGETSEDSDIEIIEEDDEE